MAKNVVPDDHGLGDWYDSKTAMETSVKNYFGSWDINGTDADVTIFKMQSRDLITLFIRNVPLGSLRKRPQP